ncbi:ABC transporter ATP-binding protein [Glaciimonas immobilis]|uniref:Branched-chain amino acid transport system ATP-binding protein n=1 Tax=Glaciimonas immobilis TaxID=728004 RepID=A0A840RR92_9BURK|nr:ABC transporter ATP-binding protein [Glaciimonas immobilis]KAF3998176.1 ABC transporter ATP-binding protein [Glaciimonas immobilis]MBB5199110.1 branched-chain amino acid transport system ATP-binding protein [Glaciimonas immobilis]
MTALLNVEAVNSAYDASQVLFGISLEVQAREVITIIGRNGMGKTTTVKTIMGMLVPSSGSVTMAGAKLNGKPTYKVARSGIGLVPEGRHVFPNLSVRENLVATAQNRHKVAQPWTLDRVYQMFPRLKERERNLGVNLSGGEQQMLAIGRALMTNPKLLILDEATEGLAPLIRAEIWDCLQRLKDNGLALIVIDKNIGPLLRLADRHYVIEKGKVVWSGTSQALRDNPQVLHEYVGV